MDRRGGGIGLFLYLSREFNFQTSLVNCDCTCGRASPSPLQLVPGKLPPQRFYAPSGLRQPRRFDLRSGKSRVNFALCFANRSSSRSRAKIYWLLLHVSRLLLTFWRMEEKRDGRSLRCLCANFKLGNCFSSPLVLGLENINF